MNNRFPLSTSAVAVMLALAIAGCAGVKTPVRSTSAAPANASLWVEPADLRSRDLYFGPWGREHAPKGEAVYKLVERKHTGVNPGLTVVDPDGREWSVKQPYPGNFDPEASVEVALSRLLSAVGYHQPPVYYLPTFTLEDDFGRRVETGGRFRLKDESLKEVGAWGWDENPFVGSRPYEGLIVLLMMFNNTDLKSSNNSLYERRVAGGVQRWYAVRDLGAALGDGDRFAPFKGHPDAFERYPFILGVQNGHVQFAYKSWYKNLVRDRITPADVHWASQLLGRLDARQWRDAFRAGGYTPDVAERFISRLQQKIEQGRSLATQ